MLYVQPAARHGSNFGWNCASLGTGDSQKVFITGAPVSRSPSPGNRHIGDKCLWYREGLFRCSVWTVFFFLMYAYQSSCMCKTMVILNLLWLFINIMCDNNIVWLVTNLRLIWQSCLELSSYSSESLGLLHYVQLVLWCVWGMRFLHLEGAWMSSRWLLKWWNWWIELKWEKCPDYTGLSEWSHLLVPDRLGFSEDRTGLIHCPEMSV